MARDLDLDFEEMDEPKAPVRPKKPAAASPTRKAAPKAAGARGSAGVGMKSPAMPRRNDSNISSIIILVVEVIVLIALIATFFIIKGKIDDGDKPSKNKTATEGSSEAGGNGGVNVESDSFTLTCTKVQLANDVDNNPVALIYFTFVNKTDTPLSMQEVFPPSLTQTGMACDSDSVVLIEYPAEYDNKNTEVSNGESIECCYAFKIYDMTSPLTLTTHDNYSTFTDIGSTEIPIS